MRKTVDHLMRYAAAGVIGLSFATAVQAADITGAGSTFFYPIASKWAEAYKAKTGTGLNYQSIGSGGGIKQIKAKTVDFGASDKPLPIEELEQSGLVQFPMIIGGIVPVVNLDGVAPGQLKLTGPVLADIFQGKITKWNDPAIQALNKDVKLTDDLITIIHRSDGSGTTYVFTNYLSKVSPSFKSAIGNDPSVSWTTGIGGKGNEGVASYVQRVKGGIGYVEYAYALQNKMTYVQLQNKEGVFLQPELKSFQAAAALADWKSAPGFNLILTDQAGKDSWPITGTTFILMQKVQDKPGVAKEALKFFDWAYHNGGAMAESLAYVPLPASVYALSEDAWKAQIKVADGGAVWTDALVQK